MDIDYLGQHQFTPWRPGSAALSGSHVAMALAIVRSETAVAHTDEDVILVAAFDGERGCYVPPRCLPAFISAHGHAILVLHNAAADLAGYCPIAS